MKNDKLQWIYKFSENYAFVIFTVMRELSHWRSVGPSVDASDRPTEHIRSRDVDSRTPPAGGRRWTGDVGGAHAVALVIVVHRDDDDDVRRAPRVQ